MNYAPLKVRLKPLTLKNWRVIYVSSMSKMQPGLNMIANCMTLSKMPFR